MKYSKYLEVDPVKHKWQAGQLEARNVQTEHNTVIHIDQFKVNVGVKDDYFTTRYMEQQ
jgi:outer membrane lipoprotein-sorting protein